MRDPSIIRTPDGTFHLVWTSSWRGDRGFGYAYSKDLVHWSEQRFIEVMPDTTTVNVWAPELFWDDVKQQAIIIWASCIPGKFPDGQEDHKNNHRLYYTTTKDFKTFSPTKLMIDPGFSCIDATLVKRGKKDYVMVLKDNTRPERDIKVAYATSPYGPWSKASEPFTGKMMEGPTVLKFDDKIVNSKSSNSKSGWLIYYDRYELKDFGAHFTKDFVTFEDVSNKTTVPYLHKHGTIFEADEAILSGLLNARKIHYTGKTLSNPNRHDGGLSPVVGVHNIQILRANREHPSEANGNGWTYNHQPMMAYWNNQFYVHYLCDPSDEHIPPSHTMYQTSTDGYTWSTPQVLFPEVQVPEGFQKPNRQEKAHNLVAIMHQRIGWYVSKRNRLYAIGNYGVAFDKKDDPNDGNGIGRVIREVRKDGTLGPIYFIYLNHTYKTNKTHFPYYTKADKVTRQACEEILSNPRYRMQWVEEADRNDPLIPLHKEYKAYCDYTLPDGQIAALWKHALTSTSADGGLTWAQPVERAKGFVNSNAKIWGQRLSDGTYATIYNPSEYRWPLAISLSKDGYEYETLNLVQGEVPPMRYGGNYKSYGPQYVRGIQEGNGVPNDSDLWVAYSMNKEDMWVAHIPVPVQTEAHSHADGSEFLVSGGSEFSVSRVSEFSMPDGSAVGASPLSRLTCWNIYSPLYAPVTLNDGWLTLTDSDPFDYARVERKIPATKELKVSFDLKAGQSDRGLLQIEFLDTHGTACSRIELTAEGIMRCKGGARYGNLIKYQADSVYHVEAILSVSRRVAEVYINGKKAGQRMFFAPVESIERVMFRTGSERRFPDVDTPADWDGILDNAGEREPEATFAIANVITVPAGSAVGDAAFLRYDDYKHYVDYFNTMEDENIVQAIPNAKAWEWMTQNVPLFDCPNRDFEEMWYYRWWTLRKHIEQTPVGYAMTEFLVNRNYADQWKLIASPVQQDIMPSYDNGFLTDPATGYALIYYVEATHQWADFKDTEFPIVNGHGYLYANALDTTLLFKGSTYGSGVPHEIALDYHAANGGLAGCNFVGNPFACNAFADRSYYLLDEECNAIIPYAFSAATPLPPCAGLIVKANASNESVSFSREAPAPSHNQGYLHFAVTLPNDPHKILDHAIVSFNEGDNLGKFAMYQETPLLYFTQDSKDLAILSIDSVDVMPMKFKAAEDGTFTLHFEVEAAELSFLHLIDNMTGANIDLLTTPTYTFNATTNDYASRFKLVFDPHFGIEEGESEKVKVLFRPLIPAKRHDPSKRAHEILERGALQERLSGDRDSRDAQPVSLDHLGTLGSLWREYVHLADR